MAMVKLSPHLLIFAASLCAAPLCGYGNTPPPHAALVPAADTSVTPQQQPAKPAPATTETPVVKVPDIIKEVPKSRRKIKPIAVPAPIPVKPLKVIKPKVIKVGI
ncbi:hypothetical protein MKQ70_01065 [Chitinophaga sedimenti]|uniref:hypothetical protein n=1 Tax=Chitinophaga sedimenti TaxID=2033606 RepID=UPI002004D5CB|nr:hypothetical protein [Chitinophaga sedimenti]MCK7553664.1 hypothetical protein [Chitinophaga sedimenti]